MVKCLCGTIYCASVHYNSYRIVCIKSLTEQVRKCCDLPSVFSQHAFLSGSVKHQYNPIQGKKNKIKSQGSRRFRAHHSLSPASDSQVTACDTTGGTHTWAERDGDSEPGSHVQWSFSLCFSLHGRDWDCIHRSRPNLFLQFKAISSVFAEVSENLAMGISPHHRWLWLLRLLAFW